MKKQSFLHGAAILAAASILCKIMSAALKIPLDRLYLHEEGIGIYQSAYSIYNVFLAFCVTGIPIALSSLIAGKDDEEAATLTKSTCTAVSLLGALFGILLFAFSTPIAKLLSGGDEAVCKSALITLSPALLVMGVISSRKGFFQGKSIMTPSAIGQLGESLAKVILGIGLCAVFVKYGIAYGAAGAIAGVTAGALVQAIVLQIFYVRANKVRGEFSVKKAMEVIKVSIPMTLGAFGFTAVLLLDSLLVPKILAGIGEDLAERLKLMGYLTRSVTIYNLPATIISAFTASAVPALAYAKAKSDGKTLGENSLRVIKLVFLASLPCALGMMLFSREIFVFIYSTTSHWALLVLSGVMVMIMPYVQTTTAMLQTMGRVWQPILSTVGAVLLKAVLNIFFVRALGIFGAPVATIVSFAVAFIINTVWLTKITKMNGALKEISKILLCAVISCGGAWIVYSFIRTPWAFLLCLALAVLVYFVLVFASGCITKSEILGKEE